MQTRKQNILYFSILFIISFIFILFACEVSSPLTNRNTCDSTIFMVMGKMAVEGKIPYVDYFDHKGPSLVLLEALAFSISDGRFAIFLLEIVNLFISLVLITKAAELLKLNRIKQLTVCAIFLTFIYRLISRGNTVEELSFIPLLISLYYVCKYYFVTKKVVPRDAFFIGMAFAFMLWLRANNNGFIVGVCIFMFINTILDKDYKSLKNLILYFVLGLLPFSLLYIAFFAYNDALYELIYATFLFNLNYVHSFISISNYTYWPNWVVFILAILSSVLYYKKNGDKRIFLFTSIVFITSILTINMGYSFPYYYLLYTPIFALVVILIISCIDNEKNIKIILASFTLVLTMFMIHKGYYLIQEGSLYKEEVKREEQEFRKLLENVPTEYRDKILYYEIYPSIYLYEGVKTNYKYAFIQEWHGRHDNKIYEEINDLLDNNSPTYVMIPMYEGDKIDPEKYENKEFYKILNRKYSIYANDKYRVILKLK